jgi:hypothetical protein
MNIGSKGALNGSTDPAAPGRWMTYDELAARRGSDRMSAVKFALRRGWRKERDNHKVARVYVPLNEYPGPPGPSFGSNGSELREQIKQPAEAQMQAHQARVVERAMWRERVARERERAESVEQEREQLLATIKDLQVRIATMEARADSADYDRRTAETHADAVISRAPTAEQDRRTAEARTDAERARADVLEQAATAQRARADAVKQQLEDTAAALSAERARADGLAERLRAISRILAHRSPPGATRKDDTEHDPHNGRAGG